MINAGKSHTGKLSAALASTTAFLCGAVQLAGTKLWQVAIHFFYLSLAWVPHEILAFGI